MSKPGVCFSLMCSQIKPFDLILFRGSEAVSGIISFVENTFLKDGSWTHVGIVITPELVPFKNGVPGKLYIWESTMSGSLGDGANDIESDGCTFGVQVRDLADVVRHYDAPSDSRIAFCKLLHNPYVKGDETMSAYDDRITKIKADLKKFYDEHSDATYDYNLCSLLKTVCAKIPKLCGSDNMYFCSELVTEIYQIIGVIDAKIDPETIAPVELLQFSNQLFALPPMSITRDTETNHKWFQKH